MNMGSSLTVYVLTKPDSLDQAISMFEQQGFHLITGHADVFSVEGKLELHREHFGYNPETNNGNVPDWAKDLVTQIIYPTRPYNSPEIPDYNFFNETIS